MPDAGGAPRSSPNLALGRHPERGASDPALIREIIDSQRICHVAFSVDGWPYTVPTVHARDGDRLFLHGSTLSRMLTTLDGGVPVCVTVTAFDGLVCARSAFNHSINYRSAMVFGTATPVEGIGKLDALRVIVESVMPGRWDEVRAPKSAELKATDVVSLPLEMATAKVRSGGPVDAPGDRDLRIWAGVLPLHEHVGKPVDVPEDVAALPLPPSVRALLDLNGPRG